MKLLCEDPAFSEYIKCILMDERTFLNNNLAYSFLTCFLHKVEPVNKPSTVVKCVSPVIGWRSAHPTDVKKDGRRVSTSCHRTKMKPKYPDTSAATLFHCCQLESVQS